MKLHPKNIIPTLKHGGRNISDLVDNNNLKSFQEIRAQFNLNNKCNFWKKQFGQHNQKVT